MKEQESILKNKSGLDKQICLKNIFEVSSSPAPFLCSVRKIVQIQTFSTNERTIILAADSSI
jgi:hypothetical protein